MVWWVDNYQTVPSIRGPHFSVDVDDDRIFQTGNILFDLCDKLYDVYDIKALTSMGVNILNLDRTIYDRSVQFNIEKNLLELERIGETSFHEYYRPISLSVTMSIDNPVAITKRTDFIILKDVMDSKQVAEFRKLSQEYESIPILLCLGKIKIGDTDELVEISDGIILDIGSGIFNERYISCIQKCNETRRAVFYSYIDLIEDYYGPTGSNRKLIILSEILVKNRFQGVFIRDCKDIDFLPTELVLSLVKAVHVTEAKVDLDADFYSRSFDVKTPAIPPLAVAYAASLAALQCDACAIMVLTATGLSAKTIAFASPTCHVIAITTRIETARRMHLYRKVIPLVYNRERAYSWRAECLNRIGFGTAFALSTRLLGVGAKLVVLAPSEEGSGYCNSLQIVSVPFMCDE